MIEQGENGYRYAKENFDRNILANQYLTYLRKLVIPKSFAEGLPEHPVQRNTNDVNFLSIIANY